RRSRADHPFVSFGLGFVIGVDLARLPKCLETMEVCRLSGQAVRLGLAAPSRFPQRFSARFDCPVSIHWASHWEVAMRRLLIFLPIFCCSVGCSSWKMRTVTPSELPSEARAQAPTKLKSLQLATLGSPVSPEYQIQPGDLLEVTISDLVGENQFY